MFHGTKLVIEQRAATALEEVCRMTVMP